MMYRLPPTQSTVVLRSPIRFGLLLIVLAIVFAPPHFLVACRSDVSVGSVDPCLRPIVERVAMSHVGCQCCALLTSGLVWQTAPSLIAVLLLLRPRSVTIALPSIDPPPRFS